MESGTLCLATDNSTWVFVNDKSRVRAIALEAKTRFEAISELECDGWEHVASNSNKQEYYFAK